MTITIPFSPGASVVAYLRDSGGEEQDLSTSEQQNAIQEWCITHGLQLSKVFRDEARPGSSVVNRAAFNEMMGHFHDPGCTDRGVIIWKYSRFSRDFDDAQFFKADLRRRGYIVYSLNDSIPDSPEGKVIESMIDWMNQRYLNDQSTDIKRGLHHLVKEYGAMPGSPPPGFKRETSVIGTRRDGTPHTISKWVIDPDTAPIVKAAWQMRAEGATIRQINQKFKLFTNRSSYSHFFKNRLYIGILDYGSKDKQTVIENYTEPIVDLDTWDTVQALNAQNSKINNPTRSDNPDGPRRKSSSFLLSGLLYCGKCGSLMNGSTVQFRGKKLNQYYICRRATRYMDCDARRIPREAIEDGIMLQVSEYIKDPSLLAAREHKRAELAESRLFETRSQIKLLETENTDLKRRIRSLIDRLASDPTAPNSIIDVIREMEKTIEDNRTKLSILKSTPLPDVLPKSPDYLEKLSKKMLEVLQSDDIPTKRQFLKLLIERITAVYDDSGDHKSVKGKTYFYGDDSSNSTDDTSPGTYELY